MKLKALEWRHPELKKLGIKALSLIASAEGKLIRADFRPLAELRHDPYLHKVCGDFFFERCSENNPIFAPAVKILRGYLDEKATSLGTMPFELKGSEFQRKVWREIAKIPHGKVLSYGEIAQRIGSPKAARAVGAAAGANPLPLLIPCHRVIGGGRDLTGFGGGLGLKQRLLEFEGFSVCKAKVS